jgi:hypothetical protein
MKNDILCIGNHSKHHVPHIAICICGQLGRLIVNSTFDYLLKSNPQVKFTLFYHLQEGYIHNTGSHFQPSPYLNHSKEQLRNELQGMIGNHSDHIAIGNIVYNSIDPKTLEATWKQRFNVTKLTTFSFFHLQNMIHLIMEMYKHQVDCATEIINYEYNEAGKAGAMPIFDYVISTREDLYFFLPFNMTYLIKKMPDPRHSLNQPYYLYNRNVTEQELYNYELFRSYLKQTEEYRAMQRNHTLLLLHRQKFQSSILDLYQQNSNKSISIDSHRRSLRAETGKQDGVCELLSKYCLKWGGLNIRMEIFTRHYGIAILHSRLSFVSHLYDIGTSMVNPERFDLNHAEHFNPVRCELNNVESPVVVARFKNDTTCFERYELWHRREICYPLDFDEFVSSRLCEGDRDPF